MPLEPDNPARTIIDAMKQASPLQISIMWKGSKTPRGLRINDRPVTWAQHGILSGPDGHLGQYDRTMEFGPDDEQRMTLYLPDGAVVSGTCDQSGISF